MEPADWVRASRGKGSNQGCEGKSHDEALLLRGGVPDTQLVGARKPVGPPNGKEDSARSKGAGSRATRKSPCDTQVMPSSCDPLGVNLTEEGCGGAQLHTPGSADV